MLTGIFVSLFSTFLSLHAMLYHPTFPPLPTAIYASLDEAPLTISVKQPDAAPAPKIGADAAIVIDVRSAEILYEKNPDTPLPPASTTKIMTALLSLESFDLDQTASVEARLASDGSVMGLVPGETIKIRDIVAGLLIPSANDAADQLSRLYPGGTPAFVARMNSRARELGLTKTVYKNPIGYEDPTHVTSVRDLAILTRKAMQYSEFAHYVKLPMLTVTSSDGTRQHVLRSTNELLKTYPGMEGVKTGWTQEAGECFVSQVTRDGQTILVVVLHSPDRFQESRLLYDWAFTTFRTTTQKE